MSHASVSSAWDRPASVRSSRCCQCAEHGKGTIVSERQREDSSKRTGRAEAANAHETPQSSAQFPQVASGAGAKVAAGAMARVTGDTESLDDLLARLLQLASQAPTAEPPRSAYAAELSQSADESWGMLRRMLMVSGASLLLAALIGVISVKIWHQKNHAGDPTVSDFRTYRTSDATVSGTVVTISSPLPGTVDAVFAQVGSKVQAGDTIAIVKTIPGAILHAKSPIAGTIVDEGATPAEVLGAGTPLAQVIDLDNLFITAYLEEGHIGDIHPGESVDIRIDAVPGVTFHGRVMRILPVPVGTFTALPSTDQAVGTLARGSPRIPVQISLDRHQGKQVYPGGTASVTIHMP